MSRAQAAAAAAAEAAAAAGHASDGDDGMVTPASHLSETPTPTAAESEQQQLREGQGPSSLAPADVRQRVLSDAAEQLLRRGAEESASVPQQPEEGGIGGKADPMEALFSAAQRSTRQLAHQSSDVTVTLPSPSSQRHTESLQDEVWGWADTPATPSTGEFGVGEGSQAACLCWLLQPPHANDTLRLPARLYYPAGGFSFMVPGSSPAVPAGTPGLGGTSADGGDGGGATGLPRMPGTIARFSQLDPNPHTGIRLSGEPVCPLAIVL